MNEMKKLNALFLQNIKGYQDSLAQEANWHCTAFMYLRRKKQNACYRKISLL